MRYLWIEDFDGRKTGWTETKLRLEKYFQIKDKNINLCTLEDALSFLDEPENWGKFDAVLIDIRFKVTETEKREEEIYEDYFSDFLKKKKYKDYAYKINGDVNSASAGVLLYLALVHKYNFNEERIAFISANVDNDSEDLIQIYEMKGLAFKAMYESLNEEDRDDFSVFNEELLEKYMEIMDLDEDEANKQFAIPPGDKIDWTNPDELLEQIEHVSKEISDEKIKSTENSKKNLKNNIKNLKYNSVKEEFEKVGLKIPKAFEKPTEDTKLDKAYDFIVWVEGTKKKRGINTDYYKLRSVILESCLHLKKLFDTDIVEHMPYNHVKCKDGSKMSVVQMKNMIAKIEELFPINEWTRNNESLYKRVIKECVSAADSICINKSKKSLKEVAKKTLKIVRNWTSHQGIHDISSFDVAYVYMMMLRVFFYCDECLEDINNMEKLLIDLSSVESKKLVNEGSDYDKIVDDMEEDAKKIHKNAYEEYKIQVGEKNAKKESGSYRYQEDAGLYDVISGIGNAKSPVKDKVCMKYVYLLYLSAFKGKGKDRVYKYIFEKSQELDELRKN